MQSPATTSLSGGYYRIDLISDGTQEIAVEGPGLFRNVWVNEIVINDLEVRPLGLDSIEFDDAGTVSSPSSRSRRAVRHPHPRHHRRHPARAFASSDDALVVAGSATPSAR